MAPAAPWAPRAGALLAATLALLAWAPADANAASLSLLDDRGWELVSPVEKNGGEVAAPGALFGGGVLQASADGEAASFSSASSFGADAPGAPVASQYISRRTGSGWTTENATPPSFPGAYGEDPAGVPYRLFSEDLARALILNGSACAEAPGCPRSYSLRQSAGGALTPSPEAPGLSFVGASPDLSHVVFSSAGNLYMWSGGALVAINVLPGETGTPEAALAAPAGAVSENGSRVYWQDTTDGRLYLREGAATKSVGGAGAVFETATPDGALAFFTEAAHLYRYDALAESATDLTPAGGVTGVLGASTDGSRVYYLTASGLFLRNGATTTKVAAGADTGNYPPPATGAARVSADGTRLAFLSSAPLTGYDNTDQNTGKADSEAFLYDASANGGAGELICASCRRDGTRPEGPSAIPGAIANGEGPDATHSYKPRALTDEGRRLFFDSRDALVEQDTNNERDVYEWEAQGNGSCIEAGGCLNLISSGRSEAGASFIDASQDGHDAFFLTDGSLVSADPGAVDLYDARAGGGFPEPPKPIPCEGDACQPLPSPPEDPTPGTQVPTEGNPPVRFPKVHKPKPHKHKKHTHKQKKHHPHGGKK